MARNRVWGHVIGRDGQIAGRLHDLNRAASFASVEISITWHGLDTLRQRLESMARQAPKATALALNRTAETARTRVGRVLVTQTGMPYGGIRRSLSIRHASATSLASALVARGGYSEMSEFRARQVKAGVSAAPWNKRQIFGGTFIIKRYGGNVYKRVGAARFPIYKLYGPAIPVEMVKDQSAAEFVKTVETELPKRLDHELGRALGA